MPRPPSEQRGLRRLWSALPPSLFLRTFLLVALLLSTSLLVWLRASLDMRQQERLEQTARQIDAIVSICRIALEHTAPAQREALFDELVRSEDIYLYPRLPSDRWTPLTGSRFEQELKSEVSAKLRQPLDFAQTVNGRPGLWIGFGQGDAATWLWLSPTRVASVHGKAWLVAGLLAAVLALIGAAVIASFINYPLRELRKATQRMQRGDFSSRLDERRGARELRELNRSFNAMAQSLQDVEQERALMLAGISHDLRTPLARLRLEAELSVPDSQARDDIAADIDLADDIIGKFTEYASLAKPNKRRVDLVNMVDRMLLSSPNAPQIEIHRQMPQQAMVSADPVELRRILANLLQNASHYGIAPGQQRARVDITVRNEPGAVLLEFRDHGPGVAAAELPLLTRPFYRGDASRSQIKGTGLGLAIVHKAVKSMDGRLELDNAEGGGLRVRIWLPHPPADAAA